MDLFVVIDNGFMSREAAYILLVLVIASAATLALCAFISWLLDDFKEE